MIRLRDPFQETIDSKQQRTITQLTAVNILTRIEFESLYP